jgi:DNA-binding GntR family transcriptional regulator
MRINPGIVNTHTQLREQVMEYIRGAILNGELRAGEFIRQQHISEQLGVSQTPVREALKQLAAEGLVENIPYRGVCVIEYNLKDLTDLFALRSFMEGRTAYAATALITSTELENLSRLVDEMVSAMHSGQTAAYRELNRAFHQTIYHASRSAFLIQILDKLWSTYPSMLPGNFPQAVGDSIPERNERDIQEHLAIIAALQKRQAETAERLMGEHIQNAGQELVNALDERRVQEGEGSVPSK